MWKLCRVVPRRVVLEDDGTTGSAAHELSISDTALENTPPTVPTRDCLDQRPETCMSGGVQGNDSRARASSATTSRCQSTHEMRQSGIMQRLSIRIVSSEARCGSCEVAHFSVAACVRRSATRTSCYRCISGYASGNIRQRISSTRPPFVQRSVSLSRLCEDPACDPGSSAHEVAPPSGSGWMGKGEFLEIRNGYVSRDLCNGQSLASPGMWPPEKRHYPSGETR